MRRTLRRIGWELLLGTLCAAWFVATVVYKTHAQDHSGHQRFHEHYQKWAQPGTKSVTDPAGASCCNARKKVEWGNGKDRAPTYVIGDCYPTTAFYAAGRWWAKADDYDRWYRKEEWIEIPEAKIIREINPDETGGMAHVCTSQGKVLCFVPSTGVQ